MEDQAARQETSLHDDIVSAIDVLEGVGEPGHEPEVEAGSETQGAAEEVAQEEIPQETGEEKPDDQLTAQPASEPAAKFKPPIDWSPTLKQQFRKLPEGVQKAISERESSVANLMQQTANERRTAHAFNGIVNQYRGLMAAEGVQDPLQAVQGLLMTTAQLAMGNPQQKARKIADLIQHYGIDIGTLDSILAGQQPSGEDSRLEAMLQQRLAPFQQFVDQFQQQRQYQVQQTQQQAYSSIHEFAADPKNEFFDDVRLSMADFLDLAAQRGQTMSLKEAYDKACALSPEISQIIAERRGQVMQQNTQQRMVQKQAAASSITGKKAGEGSGRNDGEMSLRDTIASKFADSQRKI